MANYSGASTLESMSQAGFYNKWTFKKFSKYLHGEILEVGCGIGNFTSTLAKYGKVTAIDRDESLIKKLKKEVSKIEAGYGDIEKGEYFFKKRTFDVVVCINVLEHIEVDMKALENIFNILRNDGILILLVPIHDFLYGEIDKSIGHFRRYNTKKLIMTMEQLGYKLISYKRLNLLGAVGWFIAGKVLKNRQVTENKIKIFNLISPILILESIIQPPIGTSVLIIAKKEFK